MNTCVWVYCRMHTLHASIIYILFLLFANNSLLTVHTMQWLLLDRGQFQIEHTPKTPIILLECPLLASYTLRSAYPVAHTYKQTAQTPSAYQPRDGKIRNWASIGGTVPGARRYQHGNRWSVSPVRQMQIGWLRSCWRQANTFALFSLLISNWLIDFSNAPYWHLVWINGV